MTERPLIFDPPVSEPTDPASPQVRETTVTWYSARQERRFKVGVRLRHTKGGWRVDQIVIPEPTTTLLRELSLAKIEAAANAQWAAYVQRLAERVTPDLMKTIRHKLQRPASRRFSDGFYDDVARAYRDAVAAGLNPRKTLAEDSGTPADTVARWISEARRRGKLGAAEPGRAGERVPGPKNRRSKGGTNA